MAGYNPKAPTFSGVDYKVAATGDAPFVPAYGDTKTERATQCGVIRLNGTNSSVTATVTQA